MEILIILGVFSFLYAFIKHPEIVRIDRDFVIKFGSIIITLNFVKVFLFFTIGRTMFPDFYNYLVAVVSSIPPLNYVMAAYWEDTFFVLPYLLGAAYLFKVNKLLLRNIGFILLFFAFVASTLFFASRHLYQGSAGWATIIYPIISYYVGGRKGLGTIMLLHVIFDFSAYIFLTLMVILTGIL